MSLVDTICSAASNCVQESLDLVSAVLTLASVVGRTKTPNAEDAHPAEESLWAYGTSSLLNCLLLVVVLAFIHFLILLAFRKPKTLGELKEIIDRVIQLWLLAAFKNFLVKMLRRNK
ncbi:Hypothetical predicted protein [Cloeon dipterum]|uniref:Uncharacterized protein n=1 Tax=Cloeon dipterum TaxID=197152 RepID=A0A8S1BV68_9INSE|nr:Hypothetical predicted protein [Cloeon dipterum]